MVFGKTVECLRKRTNIELVTNPIRAKKLIAISTTLQWDITSDNLVSVRKQKPKIFVDRPIYLCFCILELSKIDLYKDMANNLEAYGTSDYPVDHTLHSKTITPSNQKRMPRSLVK